MAVDSTIPPLAFKDEAGRAIGYDIDIIKAIGEKQGFDVEVISVGWDGIFEPLNQETYDIVGSGAGWSEERAAAYDLSGIIVDARVSVFHLKDNTGVNSLASLKGKKIGVPTGSYHKERAIELAGSNENIIDYPTSFMAVRALINGEVDAIIEDDNVALYYANNIKQDNPNFDKELVSMNIDELTKLDGKSSGNVFVMKKGNKELSDKVNAGLQQIKEDGTLSQIHEKWFGVKPSEELLKQQ
ncbi:MULTISPECIES: substrate-binding periplasmic protein [Moraxella]|uniref:substrate-binding periplasmic protein n=2 Tax=Moraxella TaxID=475 RepID=UPI001D12E38F|nr:transporter substrate-binding domain-containing protein [Moraxella sp. K127]